MSLADQYEAGPPATRKLCRVQRIAAALPDEEAATLFAMVADPAWSDRKTFAALRKEQTKATGAGRAYPDLPESDQFIGKHRRRECACCA